MKKLFLLLIAIFLTTGCSFVKDNLENATIYTTVYPLEYLVNTLYGDYAEVSSIYPQDIDVDTYKLTAKQNKEYAKGDLFVYNGLSNEKEITKNLINKNKNLLIIDVTSGLTYTYNIEELWMSPNNYLMLAKNLKDSLIEYLKSPKIIDDINNKYNEFSETISLMDADLRSIGKEASRKNTNTIVVTDDAFNYLQNYGFNVISLDADSATETTFSNVEAGIKKGTYKSIIKSDNVSEAAAKFIEEQKVNTIYMSTMINSSMDDDSYLVQMQRFIDDLRNLTLSD